MTGAAALHLTTALAAVGVVIASLELLARPALLADEALASWRVWQASRRWLGRGVTGAIARRLLDYPGVLAVVAARAVCALLLLPPWDPIPPAAAAGVAIGTLLLVLRSPFGSDGADQMLFIIFVSASLGGAAGSPYAVDLVLWFVTLQACLSYLTSGVAKLASSDWRQGAAVPGIFSTDMYGRSWAGGIARRHRRISRVLGWSVIVLECCFPLVLLGIAPLTLGILAAAATFHLGTAVVMRLNTFFWAFIATYPAIIYTTLG
jgi:hypothetical protein